MFLISALLILFFSVSLKCNEFRMSHQRISACVHIISISDATVLLHMNQLKKKVKLLFINGAENCN